MHAEAEGEGYPPGFHLRHTLQEDVEILQIVWGPDGRRLASGSSDGIIRLWETNSGALLRALEGHTSAVGSVAWSPDGSTLASCSQDKTIRLWEAASGTLLHTLKGHSKEVSSVAWSPDGSTLASCSDDRTIRLWEAASGTLLRTLKGHTEQVYSVAWSPDGRTLASGSSDDTIRLWDADSGKEQRTLKGHTDSVKSVTWSPDGRTLASGSGDGTIRLWDADSGQQRGILEGHTSYILSLSYSIDGLFLASKSIDGTVRLWRTDSWEVVSILKESPADYLISRLAFHPTQATTLATLGDENRAIRIWDLELDTLLGEPLDTSSVRYVNAKVVLVGDSGVGKSGLGLVLSGHDFAATESTHGRYVWTFDSHEVHLDDGRKETREILLWDLAGQAGYRLIHQLYLNEVAVALILFDSRSEIDPFAGLYHWDRALRLAQRIQGSAAPPLRKILVAARVDRGGVGVGSERIAELKRELGIEEQDYFETSAKDGRNIAPLIERIKASIDWAVLPWVRSTDFFQRMKAFLIAQKEAGRFLSTTDDLYELFLKSEETPSTELGELRAQFETCIGRIESRDLIRRLSFGSLVLLQPELLDVYASALVNAVRDEPDGLGSISEQKARAGTFPVPEEQRLKNKKQEELLLIAMVEDLLHHEIALREQADDGAYLVFPSQSTRKNPDLPDPEGKEVLFHFEGPVQNIYATLPVRLSHGGFFTKKELWKNGVTYTTKMGGTFGIFLQNSGEGQGELTLFFDQAAREEARFHFEEYIFAHLQRQALPESIQRRRIFVCAQCSTPVSEIQAIRRRELGFTSIRCNVCDTEISLLDREERLITTPSSLVYDMDRAADQQRDRETALSQVEGKIATNDFDVFLCHKGEDKPAVKEIGQKLKERGILPWLDEWELRPGMPWQILLERQIKHIKSVAVFVGKNGRGPWQDMELYAFLRQFVRRECPVIPVILAEGEKNPDVPTFLEGMTWVDFRVQDPDPMERLVWGITGKRSLIG
jgi:WD40 repeat protein